ncbi:MAG: phenylalanine--tRNA ligase subunit alpha, partial [bacterium]|nr:phenylalanine--tRNA ligase subunit alpha [bacterium]
LEFTGDQGKIFELLLKKEVVLSIREIATQTGVDLPLVTATLQHCRDQGWVTIEEKERKELLFSEDAAAQIETGLPERQALSIITQTGKDNIKIRDLVGTLKQKNIQLNEVIKWGKTRGWLDKQKDEILISEAGKHALKNPADDEKAARRAFELNPQTRAIFLDQLTAHGIDGDTVEKLLKNRPTLARVKPRMYRYVTLLADGKKTLSGDIKIIREKNQLTSEDIVSGDWQSIKLRRYDITLAAEKIHPAKVHPLQRIIQQTRKTFLEMGFTEVVSPQVESAFWDFDALFQPQDHPARDMQDTFYMDRPNLARLPGGDTVEKVKRTHQDGGETGSKGWGYQWSADRARQLVLRTHTTAATIRALSQNPNPPRKVFCVGKVFRNEAISYKHLPEFFQVDGVIIDEHASLAGLLGTLKEFYAKMGFKKIKFKPDFFPYTEPSIEVSGYMESRDKWIELGGSGIFRPEVTRPFGCDVPVMAWGLGLERLAMMRYNITDIRELYWSDLDETKEIALCQ